MSELERAIEWAQDLIYQTDEVYPDCSEPLKRQLLEQKEFAQTTITALREKQEREKCCRRCSKTELVSQTTQTKEELLTSVGFKFCPYCGRPLKGAEHD